MCSGSFQLWFVPVVVSGGSRYGVLFWRKGGLVVPSFDGLGTHGFETVLVVSLTPALSRRERGKGGGAGAEFGQGGGGAASVAPAAF